LAGMMLSAAWPRRLAVYPAKAAPRRARSDARSVFGCEPIAQELQLPAVLAKLTHHWVLPLAVQAGGVRVRASSERRSAAIR